MKSCLFPVLAFYPFSSHSPIGKPQASSRRIVELQRYCVHPSLQFVFLALRSTAETVTEMATYDDG